MLNKLSKLFCRKKPLVLQVKVLHEDAVIPNYAHHGDVGMDFTAIGLEYDIDMDCYIYHTGLAFASDFEYGQFLFPRSSNRKKECYLCNSVGVADSAVYRGEILFCYKNRESIKTKYYNKCVNNILTTSKTYKDFQSRWLDLNHKFECEWETIKNNDKDKIIELALENAPYAVGDRIGQFIMFSCPETKVVEVSELNETTRGSGGFGSTGK